MIRLVVTYYGRVTELRHVEVDPDSTVRVAARKIADALGLPVDEVPDLVRESKTGDVGVMLCPKQRTGDVLADGDHVGLVTTGAWPR